MSPASVGLEKMSSSSDSGTRRMHTLATGLAVVACVVSSVAHAQTRQETVDFIFRNPDSLLIHGANFSNDKASRSVKEENCLINLASRYNDTLRPALKDTAVAVAIDFNKLIMNSMEIKVSYFAQLPVSIAVNIRSDVESVSTDYFDYSTHTGKEKVYETKNAYKGLEMSVFAADLDRLQKAIQYFTSTYCIGKRSAF